MIIKILEFTEENIEGRQIVEDKYLINSFISNLFLKNQNENFRDSILIDNENGIYQNYHFNFPDELIKKLSSDFPNVKFISCFEINNCINDDSELYFGLFYQNKISYYVLNNNFNIFDIPKLYQYFDTLQPFNNLSSNLVPTHFNEFVDLTSFLNKINYFKNSTFCHSKISFLYNNSFKEFLHKNITKYVGGTLEGIKWLYPTFDNHNRYHNYDLFNELNIPYLCKYIDKIESKSPQKYTLVIDTETNGLPISFTSFPYPKPVQISWAIFDSNDEIVHFRDFIVAPTNYTISEKSTKIHGISDSYAREYGENIFDILLELDSVLEKCTLIIGHNLDFDLKIIESAARPFAFDFPFNYIEELGGSFFNRYNLDYKCTMKGSMTYLKSLGLNKFPKLSELYYLLFKTLPIGNHNSAIDIQLTFEIFKKMRDENLINL